MASKESKTRPTAQEIHECPGPLAFAMLGGKWKLWILQLLIFE